MLIVSPPAVNIPLHCLRSGELLLQNAVLRRRGDLSGSILPCPSRCPSRTAPASPAYPGAPVRSPHLAGPARPGSTAPAPSSPHLSLRGPGAPPALVSLASPAPCLSFPGSPATFLLPGTKGVCDGVGGSCQFAAQLRHGGDICHILETSDVKSRGVHRRAVPRWRHSEETVQRLGGDEAQQPRG